MSDVVQPNSESLAQDDGQAAASVSIEQSTYQLIRDRLRTHSAELQKRMEQLNELRRDVFGSIPTRLISTERITTANNCVARDIVSIGEKLVFGYNVHIGLRSQTKRQDVFSIYHQSDGHFVEDSLELLSAEAFQHDFDQLYKYYKNTTFSKFQVIGPFLYMVFQVGKSAGDIKSFKFQLDERGLEYLDNRSDHEVKFPPQHDFEWTRTHREHHRGGKHPHISIEDRLFVETIGGDLTIKVEDNTDSGKGIYSEPVDDADQTLDDAEVFYALVGNIITLKIRPFKEDNFRYFAFCSKTQTVFRLDEIAESCVMLPEDHGLIFSSGYLLQSGELKRFENNIAHLVFEKKIAAVNGEDYLYVFYHPEHGHYVLLSYNMIEQQVQTPLVCDGFSLFDDGRLICFRSDETPQKHHALQVWQTPFVGPDKQVAQQTDSYIYKIGNRDIVRAMAECTELNNLIHRDDSYANLYVDLAEKATDVIDSYFWLSNSQTFDLASVVLEIREAANAAINEFDKVVRIRANTKQQFESTTELVEKVLDDSRRGPYREIDHFVAILARLRSIRGQVISLRELRYLDLQAVDGLEQSIVEETEKISQVCVKYLLTDDALSSYVARVEQQAQTIEHLATAAECRKLDEEILEVANELEMLIEIVSNLKIEDATQRTAIIDNISTIFATLNKTRATLKNRSQSLISREGAAEFNSQMKLLSQAIVNYLDHCDSPQRCDEYLNRMMVQIEELEGRFAEFDEFQLQLAEKREEVYSAFDTRKLQIVEARSKRAAALAESAERILKGVASRIDGLSSVDEINSYYAADLMIEKVRDIVEQLEELDETVKVDEIQSRLKTIREDAVRQLRDRNELYVDGKNIIQFGEFKFSVNTQPLDLTIVVKEGEPYFHLSGTNFFEQIDQAEYLETRDVWEQTLVSENREVYRSEYLAYLMLQGEGIESADDSKKSRDLEDVITRVQEYMAPRYAEGYVKGVHDHDAALILQALMQLKNSIGLLRYSPAARALGTLFWHHLQPERKKNLEAKIKSVKKARELFGVDEGRQQVVAEIRSLIAYFLKRTCHLSPNAAPLPMK